MLFSKVFLGGGGIGPCIASDVAPYREDAPRFDQIKSLCESESTVQRLAGVQSIALSLSDIDNTTIVEQLVPIVQSLVSTDIDPVVRAHAIAVIPLLINHVLRHSASREDALAVYRFVVVDKFLPALDSALHSTDADDPSIPSIAENSLRLLTQIAVPAEHRRDHVLRVPIAMTHHPQSAAIRARGISLLASLAGLMGPALCQQFVLPQVLCLCEDTSPEVRAAAVRAAALISRVLSDSVKVRKLLAPFLGLLRDPNVTVRCEALSCIPVLGRFLTRPEAALLFVPIIRAALNESPPIRLAAWRVLGPFLCFLGSPALWPSDLLEAYARLAITPGDTNRLNGDSNRFRSLPLTDIPALGLFARHSPGSSRGPGQLDAVTCEKTASSYSQVHNYISADSSSPDQPAVLPVLVKAIFESSGIPCLCGCEDSSDPSVFFAYSFVAVLLALSVRETDTQKVFQAVDARQRTYCPICKANTESNADRPTAEYGRFNQTTLRVPDEPDNEFRIDNQCCYCWCRHCGIASDVSTTEFRTKRMLPTSSQTRFICSRCAPIRSHSCYPLEPVSDASLEESSISSPGSSDRGSTTSPLVTNGDCSGSPDEGNPVPPQMMDTSALNKVLGPSAAVAGNFDYWWTHTLRIALVDLVESRKSKKDSTETQQARLIIAKSLPILAQLLCTPRSTPPPSLSLKPRRRYPTLDSSDIDIGTVPKSESFPSPPPHSGTVELIRLQRSREQDLGLIVLDLLHVHESDEIKIEVINALPAILGYLAGPLRRNIVQALRNIVAATSNVPGPDHGTDPSQSAGGRSSPAGLLHKLRWFGFASGRHSLDVSGDSQRSELQRRNWRCRLAIAKIIGVLFKVIGTHGDREAYITPLFNECSNDMAFNLVTPASRLLTDSVFAVRNAAAVNGASAFLAACCPSLILFFRFGGFAEPENASSFVSPPPPKYNTNNGSTNDDPENARNASAKGKSAAVAADPAASSSTTNSPTRLRLRTRPARIPLEVYDTLPHTLKKVIAPLLSPTPTLLVKSISGDSGNLDDLRRKDSSISVREKRARLDSLMSTAGSDTAAVPVDVSESPEKLPRNSAKESLQPLSEVATTDGTFSTQVDQSDCYAVEDLFNENRNQIHNVDASVMGERSEPRERAEPIEVGPIKPCGEGVSPIEAAVAKETKSVTEDISPFQITRVDPSMEREKSNNLFISMRYPNFKIETNTVRGFIQRSAFSDNHDVRRLYLTICGELLRDPSIPPPFFSLFFKEPMMRLEQDPVYGVRWRWACIFQPYVAAVLEERRSTQDHHADCSSKRLFHPEPWRDIVDFRTVADLELRVNRILLGTVTKPVKETSRPSRESTVGSHSMSRRATITDKSLEGESIGSTRPIVDEKPNRDLETEFVEDFSQIKTDLHGFAIPNDCASSTIIKSVPLVPNSSETNEKRSQGRPIDQPYQELSKQTGLEKESVPMNAEMKEITILLKGEARQKKTSLTDSDRTTDFVPLDSSDSIMSSTYSEDANDREMQSLVADLDPLVLADIGVVPALPRASACSLSPEIRAASLQGDLSGRSTRSASLTTTVMPFLLGDAETIQLNRGLSAPEKARQGSIDLSNINKSSVAYQQGTVEEVLGSPKDAFSHDGHHQRQNFIWTATQPPSPFRGSPKNRMTEPSSGESMCGELLPTGPEAVPTPFVPSLNKTGPSPLLSREIPLPTSSSLEIPNEANQAELTVIDSIPLKTSVVAQTLNGQITDVPAVVLPVSGDTDPDRIRTGIGAATNDGIAVPTVP